jgi:hypothetical protein
MLMGIIIGFQIYSLLVLSSLIILIHANKDDKDLLDGINIFWLLLHSFIIPAVIALPFEALFSKNDSDNQQKSEEQIK